MNKIVAGHQPEFLPWLRYFNKIYQCDTYIIVDNVQFKKRYFENRSRIRFLNSKGWAWITIPVFSKDKYYQTIKEVEINNESRWREKLLKTVYYSYKKSPYFDEIYSIIEKGLHTSSNKLIDINIALTKNILIYLNIHKTILLQSQLNITSIRTQLIIDLTKAGGSDTYLSGQSGKDYLDYEMLEKSNIKIKYQAFKHPIYSQIHDGFLEGMSIIDLLFNMGKESINYMMR